MGRIIRRGEMQHWFGGIFGSSLMAIVVTCPCGKQFKVKEELAGKRGKCAACGRVLSVPTLAPSADQEKASLSPRRACPTCRQALQPNAVICLNCGHDLRTGKQLPHAKSSAPAAPSKPSAKAPASSARLWIALIAGGVCLAGVVTAVALFSWGRGQGISAVAPQPNPGTQNAAPVANAPPGTVVQSPSPKVDVPVAKEGPDSKGTPDQTDNPPALKKLLAKVTAITPEDVTVYEKFLKDPTTFNAILSFGSLPYTGDDVRDAINLGLEKPAVAALTKLAQEKKSSTDKADLLICAQSIKALGQFGPAAREAAPLLAELQNHKDIAVASSAKAAIKAIKNASPSPVAQPPPPKADVPVAKDGDTAAGPPTAGFLTFQVKSLKTQNSYADEDATGKRRIITANKAGDRLLVINLSVQNSGKAWETFSSSSFRIVDKEGKALDARFLGFGRFVVVSGQVEGAFNSLDADGNAFLKCKVKIDSLEPKNSLVLWELAPGKSYTETFVFVIPAQAQEPRFEIAKK